MSRSRVTVSRRLRLEDRRRRGVGRRRLHREKLVVPEPHALQGLRPQDLSTQLAQLLERGDSSTCRRTLAGSRPALDKPLYSSVVR
jgi:hypothetical protein